MSHTPEPWRLQELVNRDASYDDVRVLDGYRIKSDGMDVADCVYRTEDAHLITAAPDMLEALENLLAETDSLSYDNSDVSEEVKDQARAAIAKAKGEGDHAD